LATRFYQFANTLNAFRFLLSVCFGTDSAMTPIWRQKNWAAMTSAPGKWPAPSELPEGWTQETDDRILALLPHDYHEDAANVGLLIVRGGIDPDDHRAAQAQSSPDQGIATAPRRGRENPRLGPDLRREQEYDFEVGGMSVVHLARTLSTFH
jgi:hypothetical protein